MIINLQHLFKPKETSLGFEEGQETCVHRGLTEYAGGLGVPYFGLQLWKGSGEDAHVEGYALVNKDTKQVVFVDQRPQVCEYILETISKHQEEQSVESS